MFKEGFSNEQYLKMQSHKIKERISLFGERLYLEFGGKLFDDYHASRVLPGFEPDSKIKMLLKLNLKMINYQKCSSKLKNLKTNNHEKSSI